MNALKVAHGLILDFTLSGAGGSDSFLLANSNGSITSLSSIPSSRISEGGNLSESTSSILTITGGTNAILTSGLTIQVKQSNTSQSGYLSSTDWNIFNNKLSTSLTSARIFVGNGSNVATGVAMSGDIGITNAGVVTISNNVIFNANINSAAAIAFSKMAVLPTNLLTATNGSGIITTIAGLTTTIGGYLTNITNDVQAQLNARLSTSLGALATGDIIYYNGANWTNLPRGTSGQT